MSSNPDFDRWYAAKSARFLLEPSHRLETFGNTLVNYHLISELDDHPGKIRIREGRLEAHQPLVITPSFADVETEGLGDEAQAYLKFLRENEENMRILRYGFHLKSDKFSEQIVTDSMDAVADRVISEVKSGNRPFDTVIKGVDDPWDVCLMQFFWLHTNASVSHNMRDFKNAGLFK